MQSLVVMMSVGFIAFVTVLHIIGKVRSRERAGFWREREKKEESGRRTDRGDSLSRSLSLFSMNQPHFQQLRGL